MRIPMMLALLLVVSPTFAQVTNDPLELKLQSRALQEHSDRAKEKQQEEKKGEEEKLSPYQWQQRQKAAFEKSELVYTDALKRKGLLAQYRAMRDAYRGDKDRAFRIVFGQYLSWYQSFVGDYVAAHEAYSIRQLPAKDDAASPLSDRYTAKPALDAIVELAHGRKAVFLNEAHNVPLTRSLTVQLLSRLRADGFNYFAAETIYQRDRKSVV